MGRLSATQGPLGLYVTVGMVALGGDGLSVGGDATSRFRGDRRPPILHSWE